MASPILAFAPRLKRWERLGLIGFAFFLIVFGGVIELRSAFQRTRKTDLSVYSMAAWAARNNIDIYSVSESNDWHYCYPPPFSLAMMPLADPPDGVDRTGYLPFWASVAVWYALGVWFAWFAVDRLARLVLPQEPRGSRRWWYSRTVPFYICFGGIGHSLARGQVDTLLVFLFVASFLAFVSGKKLSAGAWLAAAVCIKVIPAYLGAMFLVRGGLKAIVGLAVAVVVFLFVVPAIAWGPTRAMEANQQTLNLILKPGISGEGDQTRALELTSDTGADSQSFQSVIHNWTYPDRMNRYPYASNSTRKWHWVLTGIVTITTLLWQWLRPARTVADRLIQYSVYAALLPLVAPLGHLHYFTYALPLVSALWLQGLCARPFCMTAGPSRTIALSIWGITTALPLLPGDTFVWMREQGVGPLATLLLWGYTLAQYPRPVRLELPEVVAPVWRAA